MVRQTIKILFVAFVVTSVVVLLEWGLVTGVRAGLIGKSEFIFSDVVILIATGSMAVGWLGDS